MGKPSIARWIFPVIVLPGTSLVFVPALIVWLTADGPLSAAPAGPRSVAFWVGLLVGLPSAALAVWSASMFFRYGEGTAAPWDPPRRLVVRGPYRHVRNPMLSGVIGVLFAEALLLGSWPLAVWAMVFTVGNMIYFPLFEEPALLQRFGQEYRLYSRHVRRWIPRLAPWHQPPGEPTGN